MICDQYILSIVRIFTFHTKCNMEGVHHFMDYSISISIFSTSHISKQLNLLWHFEWENPYLVFLWSFLHLNVNQNYIFSFDQSLFILYVICPLYLNLYAFSSLSSAFINGYAFVGLFLYMFLPCHPIHPFCPFSPIFIQFIQRNIKKIHLLTGKWSGHFFLDLFLHRVLREIVL